jgi:hypothetical protein
MKRVPLLIGLLAVVPSFLACGFETARNVFTPTDGPGGTAPSFSGLWTSQDLSEAPGPNSCGAFSWTITHQTPTSLAGDFTAACLSGAVLISGSASGELVGGTTIPMQASGTATMAGAPPCAFALTGTGHIENSETLRVEYSGNTCLGPVQGTETLHKPKPEPPAPPAPEPPPVEPPAEPSPSPWHVSPGPLSSERAWQVVQNTASEFPDLTAPYTDVGLKRALTEQLLLRTIWHLRLAGFNAGRQQNPSGAISIDKLTVHVDGIWRAYDIYTNFDVPGVPLGIIWWEVFPANHVPDGGISD